MNKTKIRKEAFKTPPRIDPFKKVLLLLPAVLSVSWVLYLSYGYMLNQRIYQQYGLEKLSPGNATPLMIALIIFTVGYVIFLLMMFSEDIKRFFSHKAKQ